MKVNIYFIQACLATVIIRITCYENVHTANIYSSLTSTKKSFWRCNRERLVNLIEVIMKMLFFAYFTSILLYTYLRFLHLRKKTLPCFLEI